MEETQNQSTASRSSTHNRHALVAVAFSLALNPMLHAQCDAWQPLGNGPTFSKSHVIVHNSQLIAAGGGVFSQWNGAAWEDLPTLPATAITAIGHHDGYLVAAWYWFQDNHGRVSRWNGSSWEHIGTFNQHVRALEVFEGELYAAGVFSLANFSPSGSTSANRIAKWNGATWEPVGGGLSLGPAHRVEALKVYNGQLIAAGFFTSAGGQPANNIAAWNGAAWTSLGTGTANTVSTMTIWNGDLLVAGSPGTVRRWNGTTWSVLGGIVGINIESELTIFNGRPIVTSVQVLNIGTPQQFLLSRVHRWTGASWEQIGSTMQGGVRDLTVFNNSLVVCGDFTAIGSDNIARVATWTDCEPDPNQPPIANCNAYPASGESTPGHDITLECDSLSGRQVTLDGTASYDPDAGDSITYHWDVSDLDVSLDNPDSAIATGMFPLGVTMATLTVTDSHGAVSACDVIIRVQDTTPPQVMVTTNLAMLWPPNHTLREVEVRIVATDACSAPELVIPLLVTVRSSEPDDVAGNGDGATLNDVDDGDGYAAPRQLSGVTFDSEAGAWVKTIPLRAERAAAGSGRAYTIDVIAIDASGNIATTSCVVVVPKGMGGGGN